MREVGSQQIKKRIDRILSPVFRAHAQAEEGEVTWPRKTASAPASSKIHF